MMNISINSLDNDSSIPLVKLHHLPCKIKADEAVEVNSYFTPKTVKMNGKEVFRAMFRGHLLDGKTIAVPENYCGYILSEKKKPFSEEEVRTLELSGKFETFTQWHLDSQYLSNSLAEKLCSTWTGHLADAIHKPVAVED